MTTPSLSPNSPSTGPARWLWPLPPLLIGLRFLLGPLLWFDAADGTTTPWFLAGLSLAFVSDVFDGVIARRIGRVTARLREADGWTDVWFYAWIAVALWQSRREAVFDAARPIVLFITAQMLAWVLDWFKYQRFSNYHTYLGKTFGMTLFVAVIVLVGYNRGGPVIWLASLTGIACALEEIAITLTLPTWTHDVPSIIHARRLRGTMRQSG